MMLLMTSTVSDQLKIMCLWGAFACLGAIVLLAVISLFRGRDKVDELVYSAAFILVIAAIIFWTTAAG